MHWYKASGPSQASQGDSVFRVAIPVRGRLAQPTLALLRAAGYDVAEPPGRGLVLTCLSSGIELTFVRARDVPKYVEAGVAQCGVTGSDLAIESGSQITELTRLGYGHCRLEVAVRSDLPVRELADLAGRRVATAHPRLAAELLAARGIDVELVTVRGTLEAAPRVGLADAVVDIVATGRTMKQNGLRSVGVLFASEAVVVGAVEPSRPAVAFAARLKLTSGRPMPPRPLSRRRRVRPVATDGAPAR